MKIDLVLETISFVATSKDYPIGSRIEVIKHLLNTTPPNKNGE